jgi:CubicO group peptidase (beta-lactamase class C family)
MSYAGHIQRILVGAALAFVLISPREMPAQAPPLHGIDAYITEAMREWEVPGLAIAVIKDDSVVFAKGYGVRELGQPGRVDERTLFAIASTTKAFTVAALGMLVDEGTLEWDDPVTDHLPGFQLHDPYVTRELTIRDLLTHRSGLTRGDRLWLSSENDREEILRRVRYLEPSSSFRSRYGYNNNMFIAAGEVVAAASGMSWDDFVRERIFQPLGMTASSTSIVDLRGRENVATPHTRIEGEVRPIAWHNYDNLGGAGSINSNVLEMAQWVRLQLGEGTYKGTKLLSPEVTREMHTPQTVIRASAETKELYPETHFRAYGLGWFLQDHRGEKIVHHSGYVNNMRTQVGMIPEENLGVVVITNLSDSNLQAALMYRVFDAYLGGRAPRDWSADLLASRNEARAEAEARRDSVENARTLGTQPSLGLQGYEGTYVDSLYGEVTVTREDDGLVLRMGPEYTGDLVHWHYDTFRAVWRDPALGRTLITFTLDSSGEVDALRVDGLAEFERASVQEVDVASPN